MTSKYHKLNKPTSAQESLTRSELVKWLAIDVKKDTINHYKPEKINNVFNDKYTEHKSKGDENTSIEQYLEKRRPYLGDVKKKLKNQANGKVY